MLLLLPPHHLQEFNIEHGPDVWVQLLEHCQQSLLAYPGDIVRHQPELAKAIQDLALATQQLEHFKASAAGRAAAAAVAASKAWENEALCRDLIEQYCWEAVAQGFQTHLADLDHALFKSFQQEALPRIRSLVLQYGAAPGAAPYVTVTSAGGSAGATSGSQQGQALMRRCIADVAVELAMVACKLRVAQLIMPWRHCHDSLSLESPKVFLQISLWLSVASCRCCYSQGCCSRDRRRTMPHIPT